MAAMANMDVMSDILTLDLDMRIHDVISRKKDAFSIVGDYYVCDVNNSIIATTNKNVARNEKINPSEMLFAHINSTFNNKEIDAIYLYYKIKNLDKFVYSNALQKISVIRTDKKYVCLHHITPYLVA